MIFTIPFKFLKYYTEIEGVGIKLHREKNKKQNKLKFLLFEPLPSQAEVPLSGTKVFAYS
jgi:hypothetical protein